MDLLISAAERLDLHVGYWFPETNGIAINKLPSFAAGLSRYCEQGSGQHLPEELLQ